MVTWVLQSEQRVGWNGWNDKIINRCAETGHNSIEIKIIPFERSVVGGDPIIDGPVVAYGSTAIDTVVKRAGWKPGIWRTNGVRELF